MEQIHSADRELEQFGKYTLRRRIGAGAMAEVILADLEGAGEYRRPVAVKRLLASARDNPTLEASFISEARLCGSLLHHNIVQTLDFGIHDDAWFLVMEYVDGLTLAQVLELCEMRGQAVPTPLAIEIMAQICDGLEYAHTAVDARGKPLGVVHRDLKPANILINRHGLVKIADFGIARATSNIVQTVTGTIKGTLAYMSPEQARGDTLDHRSDLFSLGVILFKMLTGQPLYTSGGDRALYRQVLDADYHRQLPLLEAFPPTLVRVVHRCLEKTPDDRYDSAAAIRRDLQRSVAPIGLEEALDLKTFVLELLRFAESVQQPKQRGAGMLPASALSLRENSEGDSAQPALEGPTRTVERPARRGDGVLAVDHARLAVDAARSAADAARLAVDGSELSLDPAAMVDDTGELAVEPELEPLPITREMPAMDVADIPTVRFSFPMDTVLDLAALLNAEEYEEAQRKGERETIGVHQQTAPAQEPLRDAAARHASPAVVAPTPNPLPVADPTPNPLPVADPTPNSLPVADLTPNPLPVADLTPNPLPVAGRGLRKGPTTLPAAERERAEATGRPPGRTDDAGDGRVIWLLVALAVLLTAAAVLATLS